MFLKRFLVQDLAVTKVTICNDTNQNIIVDSVFVGLPFYFFDILNRLLFLIRSPQKNETKGGY